MNDLLVSMRVNGTPVAGTIEARTTLAAFIRGPAGLTGTHLGCEHGVCGACTVLLDGASCRSCLLLAVQADGRAVTTVESLAGPEGLHPLQTAFSVHHALQCGYCTPGMLMTLLEFLDENQMPTEAEVRDAISGNLCRCTGYQGIVDATLAYARERAALPEVSA
jgi:carbon-monoxide dehydrogenase small subunit